MCTWYNGKPGRVIGIANRVPRKTGVLARILKGHIGQEENFQLLIRSVNASRLEEGGQREREREREEER